MAAAARGMVWRSFDSFAILASLLSKLLTALTMMLMTYLHTSLCKATTLACIDCDATTSLPVLLARYLLDSVHNAHTLTFPQPTPIPDNLTTIMLACYRGMLPSCGTGRHH